MTSRITPQMFGNKRSRMFMYIYATKAISD